MTWGRWGSRLLVVAGLLGLLVVGWSYGRYQTVWGDTPCERDRALCDEVANVTAQRELGQWYAACASLLVVGLFATLVRRGLAPRAAAEGGPAEDGAAGGAAARGAATARPSAAVDGGSAEAVVAGPGAGTWRVAASAAGRAAAVAAGVLAAAPFWFFGGSALLLATGVTAVVVLAWLVDLRLRGSGRAGDLGALLGAGLAAVAAVVLSTVVVVATVHWSAPGRPGADSWGWLLAGFVLGATVGAGAVVAGLVRLERRGLRVGATAGWAVVLLAALLVAASPPGREALGGLQRDLYLPALAAPTSRPPVVEPPPEPTVVAPPPSAAPTDVPRTVPAARACTPDDLTVSARGWDSAMGTSAVTLVVTNRSASACWVEGFPTVAIAQAGRDPGVDVRRATRTAYGEVVEPRRVGLAPAGGEAVAALSWKGYRAMADTASPQPVSMSLSGAQPRLRLPLDGTTPRIDVIEGAVMDVTAWQYPPAS